MRPEEREAGQRRAEMPPDTAGRPDCDSMAGRISTIPERIVRNRPLVHMLPNTVTVALCTDGLSALGARPLMAVAPEEMDEIPARADAVVVNMGQPTREKLLAARTALLAAAQNGVPIVWDPVGAGASTFRMSEFRRLLSCDWRGIVKGNQSEIAALQQGVVSYQGIDSVGEFLLKRRAKDGRVWAVSGREDLVFDEGRCFRLRHSETGKLMLTGSGCLTGAVMGACAAVETDLVCAALGAFFIMAYAQQKAAEVKGYGSQKQALLDALTEIDAGTFARFVWAQFEYAL